MRQSEQVVLRDTSGITQALKKKKKKGRRGPHCHQSTTAWMYSIVALPGQIVDMHIQKVQQLWANLGTDAKVAKPKSRPVSLGSHRHLRFLLRSLKQIGDEY